jgi:hypothetical protein
VIEERVARVAGTPVRSLRRIKGGGYAASFRALAVLADGRTVFVKAGAEEVTSEFVRDEQRVYASLQARFMPELVGMDDSDPPLLVLEDLSAARWPPPWDNDAIAAVLATLEEVWATRPPDWVEPITNEAEWLLGGWAEIERDPLPFLALEVCPAAWLEGSLPTLRAAAEGAAIAGDALLHLDVRSDNICIADRGAVLVDWNWVHVGNRISTSRRGCRRSPTKAVPGRKRSCPGRAASPRSLPVSSAHGPACRHRRRRRTSGACSSLSFGSPCPGRRESSACRR